MCLISSWNVASAFPFIGFIYFIRILKVECIIFPFMLKAATPIGGINNSGLMPPIAEAKRVWEI